MISWTLWCVITFYLPLCTTIVHHKYNSIFLHTIMTFVLYLHDLAVVFSLGWHSLINCGSSSSHSFYSSLHNFERFIYFICVVNKSSLSMNLITLSLDVKYWEKIGEGVMLALMFVYLLTEKGPSWFIFLSK